jgi:hypothetical protein
MALGLPSAHRMALGKEKKLKNSLPSAHHPGARQRKYFFENLFAECPSAWRSAKKKNLKNSLPSAPLQDTRQRKNFKFLAECLLSRHSAKLGNWPKLASFS